MKKNQNLIWASIMWSDTPNKTLEALAANLAMLLLSGLYFYAATMRSLHTYFWMDEVLAVSTAKLASFALVWHAIWQGAEFSPPTFDFLLHCLTWLPAAIPDKLLFRLPSILAVFGAALCVKSLLRPHVSRLLSVLGFGLVLDSGLFSFAVQARPYAILALGLSVALLLWVSIGQGRRDNVLGAMLWLVLAICVSLHFYGILMPGVICVAEALWFIDQRQIRWAVWLPLFLLLPVVLVWCPLEVHLGQMNAADIYASGYHGKPTLSRLELGFYETVLNYQMTVHVALWLLLATAVVSLMDHVIQPASLGISSRIASHKSNDLSLKCMMIALILLPVEAYLFSLLITGTLTGRYMSAAALLPGLTAAYVLKYVPRRNLLVLLTVPLIAHQLVLFANPQDPICPVMDVLAASRQKLPIAVPDGRMYIELMYNAPASERSRLTLLLAPQYIKREDPTNENQAIRSSHFQPSYHIQKLQTFTTENACFYTIVNTRGPPESVTPLLRHMKLLEHVVTQEDGAFLYIGGTKDASTTCK